MKACLILLLGAGTALAAEPLRSGPPVGEELPCSFEPLSINGPNAGEKTCILCEYGSDPVAMVFARQLTPTLERLIARLEGAADKHAGLGSTVVFLSDDPKLVEQLRQLARKQGLKHTVLRILKPDGPPGYNLAREADVTALLFLDRVVKASHVFRKGQMEDRDVAGILADLPKVIPVGNEGND